MNLKKALTYMFEDKGWANKLGIGVLVSIVPILNFAWTGYIVELMRRVMRGDVEPMSGWEDFGKKFMDGLMLFLAGLIYALPVIILVGIPLAVLTVPAMIAANAHQNIASGLMAAGGVAIAGLSCVLILYALAMTIWFPAVYVEYAKTGLFGSCFNFAAIFARIKKYPGAYFTAWGVYLGIAIGAAIVGGIAGSLVGWIPCLGPLLAFVIGVAANLYGMLVFGHLFGQYGGLDGSVAVPPLAPLPPVPPTPPVPPFPSA